MIGMSNIAPISFLSFSFWYLCVSLIKCIYAMYDPPPSPILRKRRNKTKKNINPNNLTPSITDFVSLSIFYWVLEASIIWSTHRHTHKLDSFFLTVSAKLQRCFCCCSSSVLSRSLTFRSFVCFVCFFYRLVVFCFSLCNWQFHFEKKILKSFLFGMDQPCHSRHGII